MLDFARAILTIAILFTPMGCTTMRSVPTAPGQPADGLKTGDHIIVHEISGRRVDMRFVWVDGKLLRGSLYDDGMQSVAIPLVQIEKIETEQFAPIRTAFDVLEAVWVVTPLPPHITVH